MKNIESKLDKLVQQCATAGGSQWSGLPAECGHHIIGRTNLLWRWRLINIAPLTTEEHAMTHAGLLDPLANWQKEFKSTNRNQLLTAYLTRNNMTRAEFMENQLKYLTDVLDALVHNRTTWADVIKKEKEVYVNGTV